MSDVMPWLTAFVGGLIGSALSLWAAKRQIFASVVSASRQNWINALRDAISEFQAIATGITIHRILEQKSEKTLAVEIQQMSQLRYKIELLFNPSEVDHQQLIEHIKTLLTVTMGLTHANDDKQREAFAKTNKQLTKQAQAILKREWNVVKKGK